MELMEKLVECQDCGQLVPIDDAIEYGDKYLCRECVENEYYYCEHCNELCHEDDITWVGDMPYCSDCCNDLFVMCEDCYELIPRDDAYITAHGDVICEHCRYNNYYTCSSCGEIYRYDEIRYNDDDDMPYCLECYDELPEKAIHPYNYKPIPIFYGGTTQDSNWNFTDLFIGVELEIDRGGENHENAQTILSTINSWNEHGYAKHDGSLDRGFEIVSHPATLNYHKANINWRGLMDTATRMGYRSHDTDTCGLHCHVSRRALGNTYSEQEQTISRILYFVENNWDYIFRFTRRTLANIERWAQRYGIVNNSVADTYDYAKGNYNRYRGINLNNSNTIEFRVFRGTLRYKTFMATLELVHALCMMAINTTDDDIVKLNWFDFVHSLDAVLYAELIEYLQSKGLY